MPREPKTKSSLHILREALGLKRPAFALEIGVPTKTLEAIELQNIPLSDETADVIAIIYGIDRASLFGGRMPEPLTLGRAATDTEELRLAIQEWQDLRRLLDDRAIEACESIAIPKLQLLFRAARQRGRAAVLAMHLDKWIDEMRMRLNLGVYFDADAEKEGVAGHLFEWQSDDQGPGFAISFGVAVPRDSIAPNGGRAESTKTSTQSAHPERSEKTGSGQKVPRRKA